MVNKVISSVIFTSSLVFLALANGQPDNLLFLFLSNNKLIAVSRVVLASGMMLLSFKSLLHNKKLRQGIKFTGLFLIGFGALSMLITSLSSALYNYIKLIDILIIAEAGVIYTSCAITQQLATAAKAKPAKANMKLRQKAA